MFDKVIVYGGSFNPLTLAHCEVAVTATRYMTELYPRSIISLWFMPTKQDLYNEKDLIHVNHRINMLNLFCSYMNTYEDNTFSVSKFDAYCTKGRLSTYDLMEELHETYLCKDFYFLMGSDSIERINEWDNYEKLLREHPLIVVDRQGCGFSAKESELLRTSNKHKILQSKLLNEGVSSTKTRQVLDGCKYYTRNVKRYISQSVFDYIKDNKLYGVI